jgi:hypothetical protein
MYMQEYEYLMIFSLGLLYRDIRDIKYVGGVSPNLSHWVVEGFHIIIKLKPSFFH